MNARLISSKTLWGLHQAQGRTHEIADWARANSLDPDVISVDHDLIVEDGADGRVIRYHEQLRNADGAKYACSCGEHPAVEERIVPLVVEPPEIWPVYAVPDSPR
ncbi:hypothetical protein [Streptomyces alboflavus]|uniref:hypothetical protein n=1 Tax=Streptomyces alboflavus TaxID=67267 RepID=UPI0004C198D8|nr:hypothetical protein [Streptomyces alboflavus]